VVRMTLIPAVMYLLGDKAWWLPGWLDRLLPNVDVEGEQLTRMRQQAQDAQVSAEGVDGERQGELVGSGPTLPR
jgi:putative drug exporter of the RND superfamily